MVTVYRAYSPSREQGGAPTYDMAYAVGEMYVRNQRTLTDGSTLDWTVQTGTVEWETA